MNTYLMYFHIKEVTMYFNVLLRRCSQSHYSTLIFYWELNIKVKKMRGIDKCTTLQVLGNLL